jgi:hypothetical protein
VLPKAELPPLPRDGKPLEKDEDQLWRALLQYQTPHLIRESKRFRFQQWLLSKKWFYATLRAIWPVMIWLKLDRSILKKLPVG